MSQRLCHLSRSFVLMAAWLTACSPTFDWREVRPAGSSLTLLMPCRPDAHERAVTLAGRRVQLSLHVCTAGELTWGLAWADVGEPAQVRVALSELGDAAAANIDAKERQAVPLQVPGATPGDRSERLELSGALGDGRNVNMQVALFARGTHVFQATAIGPRVTAEAGETFFASLRFEP
jgi:hypothetical protein